MIVYPWKRFWCPRGGQASLADGGFLLDPASELAKYYPTDVVPFEAIRETQCLVLLGDPGIGKSTALRKEFEDARSAIAAVGDAAEWLDLRDFSSEERLERTLLDSDGIRGWRKSQNTLYLFLDSLDEGLLRIDNISRVILSVLHRLPTARMRLRIASRPLDWQVTLEKGLLEIWGQAGVGVFQLAPLRRAEVVAAAELSGIDGSAFVDQIISRDVVPFAITPVTLKFLIGFVESGQPLPVVRSKLYLEGCKRLCEEQNLDRRDSPRARGELTPGQRMALAARIAMLTQLSNRSAVWLGLDEELLPEDLSLESIVGGAEGEPGRDVEVDLAATREALGTSLFSSRGLTRQGWQHQTYAEFLAAFCLNSHALSPNRLRPLLFHPDGSGTVIPQLREVAVWLAGMNSRVFQMLVRSDPEVLLRTDMAVATSADRNALTRRLLESFESGGTAESLWSGREGLARLNNPELARTLRPYLSEASHSLTARVAAVEIAEACHVSELQMDLVALALNQKEPLRVRARAAEAIATLGDAGHRVALRPLALGLAGDDPEDELRAYGLRAIWPMHLSAEELFSALAPPKRADNIGGDYNLFLGDGIVGQLKADDFVPAIFWARKHSKGRDHTYSINTLASELLEHAVDHLDQGSLLPLFAEALLDRMGAYTDCDRITAKLCAAGDNTRRAVASAMFSSNHSEPVHGAYLVMESCALSSSDIPWLLGELSGTQDARVRRVIAEVISRRLDGRDVDTFDAVKEASSSDPDLLAAIAPLVQQVLLPSAEADRMKAHHDMANQRHQRSRPALPVSTRLSEILARSSGDDMFAQIYWLLVHSNGSNRGQSLPGWPEIPPAIRTRILSAASGYLRTRPPTPEGEWWKEGSFTVGLLAGTCALRLLAECSPISLDLLSDGDWSFWTKVILADAVTGDVATRSAIVARAYERARGAFLSAFSDIVDGEARRCQQVLVVPNIGSVWGEDLAAILHSKLADGAVHPKSFRDILSKLLSTGDAKAKLVAHTAATRDIPRDGDARLKAVYAAAELMTQRSGRMAHCVARVSVERAFRSRGPQTYCRRASIHELRKHP